MTNLPRRISLTACLALALTIGATASAASAKAPAAKLYVSLGDSYATGYQPGLGNTRDGFAYQLPALAELRGHPLALINFGCGGETTTSLIMRTAKCNNKVPAGASYAGHTQLAASTAYIRSHRAKVGLITVSIGGNDVTACVKAANPITCVAAAQKTIKKNVTKTAKALRAAAGPGVQIVGTTYPDVILGLYTKHTAADDQLASLSVAAFKSLINPTLKAAYASAGAKFVDVTAATGAYGDLKALTDYPPYGQIPKPAAKVCELTWFCSKGDIHSKRAGYRVIAKLVAATLPKIVF
jgi:lysophospholipase L1-like esterase